MLSAKVIAFTFGAVFVFVGLLGFVPNPIVSPDGLFAVNTMHNAVHILTGMVFATGAHFNVARQTILGVGIAYVGVTIAGFLTTGTMLLGLIHINGPDRWLHAALAMVILAAGWYVRPDATDAGRAAKPA